jgi:hypothetical protein
MKLKNEERELLLFLLNNEIGTTDTLIEEFRLSLYNPSIRPSEREYTESRIPIIENRKLELLLPLYKKLVGIC